MCQSLHNVEVGRYTKETGKGWRKKLQVIYSLMKTVLSRKNTFLFRVVYRTQKYSVRSTFSILLNYWHSGRPKNDCRPNYKGEYTCLVLQWRN